MPVVKCELTCSYDHVQVFERVQKPAVAAISDRTQVLYNSRTTGYASSRVVAQQVARSIVRP